MPATSSSIFSARRSAPTTIWKKCGAKPCRTLKAGSRRKPHGRPTAIRIHLFAVGRLRRGPEYELQAHYAGRITPPVTIIEIEEKRRPPPADLKRREAELILAALPSGGRLVALDERGAAWSSRQFAEKLATWRDAGAATLAFAIGGADGLGQAVIDRADALLSLGAMTWPH